VGTKVERPFCKVELGIPQNPNFGSCLKHLNGRAFIKKWEAIK